MTIFAWLIVRAWREHDLTTAAVVTGAMVVLGIWSFLQRGNTGAAATRAAYRHLTLCCAVVVAVICLRLDVWAAAAYGVSVTEVHGLLPLWIVPLLALALVVWIAAGLVLTNPDGPSANPNRGMS